MTTLRLDRKLYPKAALKATVSAFSDLATIEVTADDRYHVITMTEIDPEVADVIDREFANFALAEAVESRR